MSEKDILPRIGLHFVLQVFDRHGFLHKNNIADSRFELGRQQWQV